MSNNTTSDVGAVVADVVNAINTTSDLYTAVREVWEKTTISLAPVFWVQLLQLLGMDPQDFSDAIPTDFDFESDPFKRVVRCFKNHTR